VPDVAHPGEDHGEAGLVGSFDHFPVALRTAGLDHRGGAASAAASKPSRMGQKASDATTLPIAGLRGSLAISPASAARMAAIRELSRRLIWAAPTPLGAV
jgi:hypothetical protein